MSGDLAGLLAELLLVRFGDGGKLLIAGNGGSAADASHIAAEFVGSGLPAISLSADQAVVTALANDHGFEEVFSLQVDALGEMGDVLLLLSTSGRSENVLRAARTAKARRIEVVLCTGPAPADELAELADHLLGASVRDPGRIQEGYLGLWHDVWARVCRPVRVE